jgi:hypothetical protein
MNIARFFPAFLALTLAALSCNIPSSTEGLSTEVKATLTALSAGALVTPTPTYTPDPSLLSITATPATPPTACSPLISAPTPVNVRSGPGMVYPSIDNLSAGQTAVVAGKNNDGTWWYINRPAGGTGWVSASVVTASCIPAALAVIAAPPTPLPASGTCKDGYVWRLIRPSDKVCVPPASKTQADSDNAAADSRKVTATYGPDTCATGYVWRDAFSGDHVCVDPSTRTQAAADNAAAASRVDPLGAYGPDTCVAGFVWREASSTDHVCVDPSIRTQAAADNAAAASRKATALYGPDTCASGFVWRDAFTNDHVCVTPAVRTQTAADNAAAPSHTW